MIIEQLPRDLVHEGHWLTLLYRQKKEGGAAVYLQNSEPGLGHGQQFHVIKIDVINGKERLGETLAVKQNCEAAISIAGQAP
jgi:hypothetical protein